MTKTLDVETEAKTKTAGFETDVSRCKPSSVGPVAKVAAPKSAANYRPISVTLARMMERTVVQRFLYPAFQSLPSALTFMDQFGFRPTGSTTAAIIYLPHTPPCLPVTHTS